MPGDPVALPQGAQPGEEVAPLTVEDAYFQAWGKVGGAGRLRRTFSLYADIRRMIEFQVRKRFGELSDPEIQRRTAKQMYLSDDAARGLLDRSEGGCMEGQGLPETMARISRILMQLDLRYHFTGGIAATYYGDPRLTQDLDLVIDLDVDQPETRTLLGRLSQGYLIHEQAVRDAIEGHGLFQAIDEESLVKVDFHVGEKIPGELSRSRPVEAFPGVVVPLVAKEDAILSKLMWIRLGSHKARHDVKMMLKRAEEMDSTILHERAAALGLEDLLNQIEGEG
jgi:hypothetical protein